MFDKNKNSISVFAERMYPMYYEEYVRRGLSSDDAKRAAILTSTQAAWESNYGTSRVARQLHNYGGYGWNGKTYTTFKDNDSFVKAHVALAMKNGMHNARNLTEYAKIAKQKGYYEDSLENYTRNLNNMRSYANYIGKISSTYQPRSVQTTDTKYPPIVEQPDVTKIQKPQIVDNNNDVRFSARLNSIAQTPNSIQRINNLTPWSKSNIFNLLLNEIHNNLQKLWTVQ